MKKMSKRMLVKHIEWFASELTRVDRIMFAKEKDYMPLAPTLCEILDGSDAEAICKEVGDMSVNQWWNYLELALKGTKGIH
jgi:hypothetical protein